MEDLGPIDGVNMWPVLTGERADGVRKELLLDLDPVWNKSAIRVGDWKLVQGK